MIWQYALSVPWIVEVVPLSEKECRVPNCDKNTHHRHLLTNDHPWDRSMAAYGNRPNWRSHWFFKTAEPPALLATCVESRMEALEAYEQYQIKVDDISTCFQGPIWFRPDRDILFLKNLEMAMYDEVLGHNGEWKETGSLGAGMLGLEIFANVKALAINASFHRHMLIRYRYVLFILFKPITFKNPPSCAYHHGYP